MSSDTDSDIEVVSMTKSDAVRAFDRVVQREMGMSGEDFLRRWDAGEWAGVDLDDVPGLADVWMMLPLVGRVGQDTDRARPNAT